MAIEDKNIVFLVSEEAGHVIGCLHGGKNKKSSEIPCEYEVYGLYIDPAFQCKGAGRALLVEFKKQI